MMGKWLVAVAGGYVGLGAMAFLLYRAAHVRTRHLRSWTDERSGELVQTLTELRSQLHDLSRMWR
ncbi:MAG: hypothetical protein ACRDI2_10695 [Chloroflexota bacterium]